MSKPKPYISRATTLQDALAASSEFLPIPGYEDRFEINRHGVVRSIRRPVNSPVAGGSRMIGGKVLKPAIVKGYPAIQPNVKGTRKTLYLHRAMAELFVPNPDGKPFVNHIDGDKTNMSPDNLEWCTHKENMRHAFSTGLAPNPKTGPGEASPSAKLNNEKVRLIKYRLKLGESHASIAADFDVRPGTITFIANGDTWAHVRMEGES